jgi:hypothetical protein
MVKGLLIMLLCGLIAVLPAAAQYPPPAGQPGSTAIPSDSPVFKQWASGCTVVRGFINIQDTTATFNGLNHASYGLPEYAAGIPDTLAVSLGDGGYATLDFPNGIRDGEGFDFAIFENGFSNGFLELAFVEVSSDGQRFFRFPAVSLTQSATQVGTFDTLDATKINNLAGKYRIFYGTPFDLSDLADSSALDREHIIKVRVVDVIGCIQPEFSTVDSRSDIVNDPWPTPFHSGGFDLEAVGVINPASLGLSESEDPLFLNIFPNPVQNSATVTVNACCGARIAVTDLPGRTVLPARLVEHSEKLDFSGIPAGIYLLVATLPDGRTVGKKIVKK